MGLLKVMGLSSGNQLQAIAQPAAKSGWWRSFLTGMNATEDCVILQGGKKITHKVPQFFWIHNAIQWAYNKNRVAKTGMAGLLEKAGVTGAKLGFKFLQLPLIKSVSPLMQGNLLFSLASAAIGSVFKLATGNVTGAIHNTIGAGAAIFGTAALAKYIPLAMGMNPLTGSAAAIGFALTMFVEPKIRRMMGLDKDPSQQLQQGAIDPRLLLAQQQMQQSGMQGMQGMMMPGMTANGYPQQNPNQYLTALSGGQAAQYAPNPYGYYQSAYPGMTGYGAAMPQVPGMSGYAATGTFGGQDQWSQYYQFQQQQQQQQQLQQSRVDADAQQVMAQIASKFKGLQHSSVPPSNIS